MYIVYFLRPVVFPEALMLFTQKSLQNLRLPAGKSESIIASVHILGLEGGSAIHTVNLNQLEMASQHTAHG
jgi:hypothetical protein